MGDHRAPEAAVGDGIWRQCKRQSVEKTETVTMTAHIRQTIWTDGLVAAGGLPVPLCVVMGRGGRMWWRCVCG